MGATDCIVVKVVVSDRTEGAGEENVLSAPLAELTPQPIVLFVASPDDGACDGAASDADLSGSVDDVAATDCCGRPSREDLSDCLLRSKLDAFGDPVGPVGTVEVD